MPYLVYNTRESASPGFMDAASLRKLRNADPNRLYLHHYKNLLYLDFIHKHTKDEAERSQAAKELVICRRKLAYWQRHKDWDATTVANGTQALKRDWNR